jgi:hypothetical protein
MWREERCIWGLIWEFKKRELGRPRHSRMDNSKVDLLEWDKEGM